MFQTNSPEGVEDLPKPQVPFKIFSDNESKSAPRQSLFKIYDENSENAQPLKISLKPKLPFDIYEENEPPTKQPAPLKQGFAFTPKVPFEIYDENVQTNKTPITHFKDKQPEQTTEGKNKDGMDDRNGRLRHKLFPDGGEDLAKKMQNMFPAQVMF